MNARRQGLWRDRRGGPTMEFAMLLPVMLTLTMGLGELGYEVYVQSVLTGAVQKAGRDSGIQGGATQTDVIDAVVKRQVGAVVANGTYVSTRTNFDNYAAIAGEPFTDSKWPNPSTGTYDGICNHGEPYIDINGNNKYDIDLSNDGQGGANDITKYTMTLTYKRLFPVRFLPWTQAATLSATTLLKNQPYATQTTNTGTNTGKCA